MLKTQALQYAMLCTAPEVCLAMSQSRGTRVIHEQITEQRSKLSLVTSGLRNFLDYGGGKRVRRKGLRRCKLDTYPDSSEQRYQIRIMEQQLEQLQVEQLFGIAPNRAWQLHLGDDIEICKAHTDLKDSDPLTIKPLTQAYHDQTQNSLGVSHIGM